MVKLLPPGSSDLDVFNFSDILRQFLMMFGVLGQFFLRIFFKITNVGQKNCQNCFTTALNRTVFKKHPLWGLTRVKIQ